MSEKEQKIKKIAVLGAGSWGTALAHHLRGCGHQVCVWGNDGAVLREISSERRNRKYFGETVLAPGLTTAEQLADAVSGVSAVVIAVPSTAMRSVAAELRGKIDADVLVVSTAKGLEEWTLKRMSEVLSEELIEGAKVAALSGPSFAQEVLRGLPTVVTVAGKSKQIAEETAEIFRSKSFRVYTSTDLVGVELGGAVKNIMAIAAGVVDGLQMGANARAALITRGLSEMQQLVVALGGDPRTIVGLSGLGDLLLTATGDLSRNRQVGVRLGQGEKLEDIVASLGQVAEGVGTTHKVLELAQKHNVKMPIVEEMAKLLSGARSPQESAVALLTRTPRDELG